MKLTISIKIQDEQGEVLLLREYLSTCEGDTCLAPPFTAQELVDDAIKNKNTTI